MSGEADGRGFHALDALRGIAALSIVLFHAGFLFGLRPPAEGQVAVDLFFAVSGFIIAFRYDARFAAGLTAGAFLRRRLVRLYPLILLGSLLGAVPALVALALGQASALHRHLLAALPLAAAMLPAPAMAGEPAYFYPLDPPAWTLALEILVNAAYAATFSFWTRTRLLVLLAGAAGGLGLVAWREGTLDVGFFWSQHWGGLARILFGFTAGVLLFRFHAERPFSARRWSGLLPWWSPLLLAAGLFALPPPLARGAWEFGLILLVVPTIVALAVARDAPNWARRACTAAGVASYVVYAIHFPLVGLFLRGETLMHLDAGRASPGRAAAFAVLLATGSLAAYFGFDRPVRGWLARRGRTVWPLAQDAAAKS